MELGDRVTVIVPEAARQYWLVQTHVANMWNTLQGLGFSAGYGPAFRFSDLGIRWIWGHHVSESPEGQALLAAWSLTR